MKILLVENELISTICHSLQFNQRLFFRNSLTLLPEQECHILRLP